MKDKEGRKGREEDDGAREQRAVQSVEVGGRLLLALAEQPGPLTLKDLAQLADLPPSRAHPYLVSFGKLGLIVQDVQSGRYALGPAALRMGLTCLFQSDPMKAANPAADELAASTGHAVALSVWGNMGPTVVRLIDARQPLHVSMRAGTVMSIFGTATGRAFVGALGRQRMRQALEGPLGGAGVQPSMSRAEIDAEFDEISGELKKHGITRAIGRPIPGVNAFAAPIYDHEGRPVLVITALGHQDHFPSAWTSPVAAQVLDAAKAVSLHLGHRSAR